MVIYRPPVAAERADDKPKVVDMTGSSSRPGGQIPARAHLIARNLPRHLEVEFPLARFFDDLAPYIEKLSVEERLRSRYLGDMDIRLAGTHQ